MVKNRNKLGFFLLFFFMFKTKNNVISGFCRSSLFSYVSCNHYFYTNVFLLGKEANGLVRSFLRASGEKKRRTAGYGILSPTHKKDPERTNLIQLGSIEN